MSLSPGFRLGPYEVTLRIGAGGMGEVYKARDTKLNRMVAIKALQPSVSADPERVARFEREAQLLASLQHPNIAGIYGLEQAAGATYLVLEFVDGKPLDRVIKESGAMSIPEAIGIARQIADAIAAAHEKGIIHRDLKPANVMLTADGQVKVLDFGLGKTLDEGRSGAEATGANSPTITLGGTQAGIILGTAGYMSPEQAKGRAADRRSDVWSFGCLLFELISGSRAFEGEDITDTIAAIVRGEPNWKALPAGTPPGLRQLLERSLIKDRSQRLPDMSVVRYILSETGLGGATAGSAAGPSGAVSGAHMSPSTSAPARGLWPAVAALGIMAALVMGYVALTSRDSASRSGAAPAHFAIVLPEDMEVAQANLSPLAISRDGQLVAFGATRGGQQQLFLYDVATGALKPLPGTDGGRSPFFSPDGRWIGYFARSKVRKITASGASGKELADAYDPRGGGWSTDGFIYYAPTNTSGLWRVPDSGGTAVEVTKPDPAASEISHRNPYPLPDGKSLLFQVWTGPGFGEHRIEYLSVADGKRQVVIQNADGPISVVNGRIMVAAAQDVLLSAPWNPSAPSLEKVEPTKLAFYAKKENEGAAAYAVSETGTVVRLDGALERRMCRIVWLNRTGKVEPLPLPERDYAAAVLSPDGTRAAIQIRGVKEEIWIYNFTSGSFTPLVTPGSSQAPVWTMDSKHVVYRGTREGFRNLFRKQVDGGGAEERLTTRAGVIQSPTSATPDGRWIVYSDQSAGSNDLLKVSLHGNHEVVPVLTTPASELNGQVSPDSRWIAFESLISGRWEVWVRPFDAKLAPTSGDMKMVSREGGQGTRWSHDAKELFFMTPGNIMAVNVTGDAFSLPKEAVRGRFMLPPNANTNYSVARDGRILHIQPVAPTKADRRIEVVLNAIGK